MVVGIGRMVSDVGGLGWTVHGVHNLCSMLGLFPSPPWHLVAESDTAVPHKRPKEAGLPKRALSEMSSIKSSEPFPVEIFYSMNKV